MGPTTALLLHASASQDALQSSYATDAINPGWHLVFALLAIAVSGALVASQLHSAFAESRPTATVCLCAGVRPRMDFSLQDECVVIKANTSWTLSGKTASGQILNVHGEGSKRLEFTGGITEITVLSE